jgi:hypothetical protein
MLCRTQRYRRNSNKLSKQRVFKLTNIEFGWGRSPESSFETHLSALAQYKKDHNGARSQR